MSTAASSGGTRSSLGGRRPGSCVNISWADAFETGSPEIDALHRQMIEECNRLLLLMSGQASWPLILAQARRLVEHSVDHFRLEESILESSRFPRCAEHALEHRRLECEMRRLVGEMETVDGSLEEHFEIPASLIPSLIDFIVRHDLDFRSHLLYQQGR